MLDKHTNITEFSDLLADFDIEPSISTSKLVFGMCDQLTSQGHNQVSCSKALTAWFKTKYPEHNFTSPKNNPVSQNKLYDNIRSGISRYFKQSSPKEPTKMPMEMRQQLKMSQQLVLPMGHAWLLTGYDHVDGNQRWKYQGRFIALNAWNIQRTLGKGIVTLPFAMLLTEGIEAFAIRLKV